MRHSVPSSQSKAQHTFARSPEAHIPRASFNRSHTHKTTFNEGYLVPIFVDEVLPGDTFRLNMTAFARLATPIFPIMDNIYMESFFFFVPNRLVWDNWERFNGAQDNPASSTSFILPTVTAPAVTGVQTGDLLDYMGLPIAVPNMTVQSLPCRAYNLIYNEWFRDENLQNSIPVDTDDGPDTYADYVVRRRGKRHDYFTSCLPWPQKINDGSVVSIPLGTTAPVVPNGLVPAFNDATSSLAPAPIGVATVGANQPVLWSGTTVAATNLYWDTSLNSGAGQTGLRVNLSAATAGTINQLRQAFQLQKLFERDARGGTRYTEIIRAHFGVISPDMRLQRPEYLGGGMTMININPVAQTTPAQTDDIASTPKGDLAAFGTATLVGHGFTKSFTEHGHIIGIIATRADLNYQQGQHRMWNRSTRYDFYWPALSQIGEQVVFNYEIFTGSGNDGGVFGYQERYAEYRYKPGQISGLFRSAAAGSLDSWHLAQDFATLPTLGATFIVENAPMERVKAVTSQPDFIFDSFFDMQCARPMPLYGVPGLVDHF